MSTDFITGYFASNDDHTRAISVNRKYIDMCDGNLPQAVLLSQIVFWHGTGKDGKPRMKVVKDGHRWIAKTPIDWQGETGIPESTTRAAIGKLAKAGLIHKKIWKFNGEKCTHIRLDLAVFELMLKNNDTIKGLSARIEQMHLLESSRSSNIDDNIDEKIKNPTTDSKNESVVPPPTAGGSEPIQSKTEELTPPYNPESAPSPLEENAVPPQKAALAAAPDLPKVESDHQKAFWGVCFIMDWETTDLTPSMKKRVGKVATAITKMVKQPEDEADYERFKRYLLRESDKAWWDFPDKPEAIMQHWPNYAKYRRENPMLVVEPEVREPYPGMELPCEVPTDPEEQKKLTAELFDMVLNEIGAPLAADCGYDPNVAPETPMVIKPYRDNDDE